MLHTHQDYGDIVYSTINGTVAGITLERRKNTSLVLTTDQPRKILNPCWDYMRNESNTGNTTRNTIETSQLGFLLRSYMSVLLPRECEVEDQHERYAYPACEFYPGYQRGRNHYGDAHSGIHRITACSCLLEFSTPDSTPSNPRTFGRRTSIFQHPAAALHRCRS
jgi:hypothetical protein